MSPYVQTTPGLRFFLYGVCLPMCLAFGIWGMYLSSRPFTAEEKAQAVWDRPEWEPTGPGIYKFPGTRYKKFHGYNVETEEFDVLLVRFVQKHPELEIVSTTPILGSFGDSTYTEYVIVVTRPRQNLPSNK